MSDTRNEIIESMARTLYVCAYADFIERAKEDGEDVSDLPQAPRDAKDWMDVAPETTEAARDCARLMALRIEERAKATLAELYRDASEECKQYSYCKTRRHNPDQFGHYLAMAATGTGVDWSDDHAPLAFEVPSTEFHIFGRDDAGWGSVSDRLWS